MVGPNRQKLLSGRRAVHVQQVISVIVEDDPPLALDRRLSGGLKGGRGVFLRLAAGHPSPKQECGQTQYDP